MRFVPVALALALLASCGKEPEPPKKTAPPPPPKAMEPELKSDPTGKNLCLKCNFRTNDAACPKCKTVLKAAVEPEKPKTSTPAGEVGKSAVSAVYACPKEGCKFTDARKGKCLPHPDVDLKEQWFVCEKCSVKEPVAGKCSKCQSDLVRKLQ